jgi:hypothetical protein
LLQVSYGVTFRAMTLRSGVYMVPTNRWYIERTVWLIAGVVLLVATSLTGFCPVGNVLRWFGFTPMLGENGSRFYFMQTDKWYLERRIYLAVGINISVASVLILACSAWVSLFTIFVGGATVWFAATGFCVMANALYWLGAEPRLTPETMPSGRCEECGLSGVCVGGHKKRAQAGASPVLIELH